MKHSFRKVRDRLGEKSRCKEWVREGGLEETFIGRVNLNVTCQRILFKIWLPVSLSLLRTPLFSSQWLSPSLFLPPKSTVSSLNHNIITNGKISHPYIPEYFTQNWKILKFTHRIQITDNYFPKPVRLFLLPLPLSPSFSLPLIFSCQVFSRPPSLPFISPSLSLPLSSIKSFLTLLRIILYFTGIFY